MGTGSGDAPEEDASEDDDGTPAADSPCDPTAAKDEGWIRIVDGTFQLDFGEYEWSDEVFGCDSEPPCVSDDGSHLRVTVPRSGDAFAPLGEFSIEEGTLAASERECGCCNGEGGDIEESWDDTYVFESARLEIDGADAGCVSGRWLERDGFPSGRTFVARWCR